jgi:hypothetical protein
MANMPELHVRPDTITGGWMLDASWFATLAEAAQTARQRAAIEGALVFLHDRYHRVAQL